jgi:hypothetical protein
VTYSKLNRLSRAEVCEELVKMVLCATFPNGCTCRFAEIGTSLRCDWCDNRRRVRTKVWKLLNRMNDVPAER